MAEPARSIPLRRRLLLLAAAGMLPVAIMSAIALAAIFRQQSAQGERTALEIARALSTAIDAELLRSLAALEAMAPSIDARDLEAFRPTLMEAANRHPNWANMVINGRDGRQLLNTRFPAGAELPVPVQPETVADVVASGGPVVGALVRGTVVGWVVPVRVPVRDKAGNLAVVLSAAVTPASLLEVLRRQRLEEGWVMTALDSSGKRVLRWPGQAEYVGAPLGGTLGEMLHKGGDEGTGLTRTSQGADVYTAFTRSPQTRWVIAIGIPRDKVEAPGWKSLRTFGAGLALSLLVGALAALAIARSIARPMAQLRAGLPVATDIREIRDVSEALEEAARQRATAQQDREQLLQREQAARAAAEAANRAKDEFLAMLGHELRNPLGAVSNAAHLLQAPNVAPDVRAGASAVILRQVGHLTRLTDDLLDAGRALMGKIVLRRVPLDVAAAAAQSLATLRATGRLQRHRVTEVLEPAWAEVDAIRLDQIVGNLVVNATKYTPDGGHIRVAVRRDGAEVVIRVADDGIGMEPELAARAFELFVQGERDLDRAQGGLGIGLTLVRRLAELHGGSAAVRSDGPGRGSEFTVRLPAIEPQAAPAVAPDAPGRRERSVLVIEDNDDARETLQLLLQAAGHRVAVAPDGADGLAFARSGDYEVALVDIGLPGLDGYEIARTLRAEGRALRLVALTGYGLPEDQRRALDAGFDAHLVKPVDPERLSRLLDELP